MQAGDLPDPVLPHIVVLENAALDARMALGVGEQHHGVPAPFCRPAVHR